MHVKRVQQIYEYALAVAADAEDWRDRELGPIHLLKIAYLVDLDWATHHDGETWTEIPWRFHHFGPWDVTAWQEIEPTVQRIGANIRTISHPQAEDDSFRYRLAPGCEMECRGDLLLIPRLAIRRAVQEYGSDTVSLLNHVYTTGPMVNAAPEELLDFSHAIRKPCPKSSLERTPLTTKQKKRRKERLDDLRTRVNESLQAKADAEKASVEAALQSGSKPPRYDEVYYDGLEWLDSLVGNHPPQGDIDVVVIDTVWHSDTRRNSDLG